LTAVLSKEHAEAKRFADHLRQIIDRHALLIMRELSMNVRRFQEIEAQTKIGSPLLASRLRRLERDGIIERRLYCEHPPRYEYFATDKGKDLDSILFAAGNWNIKWGDLADPSLTLYDKGSGKRLSAFPGQGLKAQSDEKP
jgi:DNA-binding HxlR family transcriptional regulator